MSKIVIKKKVSLGFLGDEYKDAYITFRSMPIKDYSAVMDRMPVTSSRFTALLNKSERELLTEKETNELEVLHEKQRKMNQDSFTIILDVLKEYFIEGKFPDESGKLFALKADDLEGLDSDSTAECFSILTGQDTTGGSNDPKAQD